ncbi:MAG: LysR family transcriptional regulator [Eubacterium sp.]|nr:LysR family transcriptional regulator [Eubacterium sp.]
MRISDIQLFIEVANNRSLRKTAEQMYITQQGLSRIIDNIENELGAKLLERTARGVNLTKEGQLAFEYFEKIQEDYSALHNALLDCDESAKEEHIFYIYTSPIITEFIIDNLIKHLKKKFPQIQFIIRENAPSNLIKKVDYYNNSLCIINLPESDLVSNKEIKNENLIFNKIYSEKLMLAVPTASASEYKSPITTKELATYSLIVINWDRNSNDEMMKRLLSDKSSVPIVTNTTNSRLFNSLLAEDLSCCGITSPFKEYFQPTPGRTTLPIKDSVTLQYGIIYSPECKYPEIVNEITHAISYIFKNIKE